MEKLQKALEKARNKRGDAPHRLAGSRPRNQNTTLIERWEKLIPYEPRPQHLITNRIVAHQAGGDATHFDVLRTKIISQMRKNGWTRLAITSPTAQNGKTTTAANLAFSLSRQPDIRAILFELDLLRPALQRMLSAKAPHDITDMLSGEVDFSEQALRIGQNVALSIAQVRAANPSHYLLSVDTQERLQQVDDRYRADLTLFDLPPMLTGDQARGFLSKVDCALIVARAEKSTVAEIDACEREIAEHTNVLGVVLNRCRFTSSARQGYGYED